MSVSERGVRAPHKTQAISALGKGRGSAEKGAVLSPVSLQDVRNQVQQEGGWVLKCTHGILIYRGD